MVPETRGLQGVQAEWYGGQQRRYLPRVSCSYPTVKSLTDLYMSIVFPKRKMCSLGTHLCRTATTLDGKQAPPLLLSHQAHGISSQQLVAAAVGVTAFDGVTYTTVAQNITGLIEAGSTGVNHGTHYPQ